MSISAANKGEPTVQEYIRKTSLQSEYLSQLRLKAGEEKGGVGTRIGTTVDEKSWSEDSTELLSYGYTRTSSEN